MTDVTSGVEKRPSIGQTVRICMSRNLVRWETTVDLMLGCREMTVTNTTGLVEKRSTTSQTFVELTMVVVMLKLVMVIR